MEQKCVRCNKNKSIEQFTKNNRVLKQCNDCRTKNVNRNKTLNKDKKKQWNENWKEKNKQRTKDYNKYYREKNKKNKTEKQVVKLRKVGSDIWDYQFDSLAEASRQLNLYSSNISHVINGKLSSTNGYEAKYEIIQLQTIVNDTLSWEDICKEKNYENSVIGNPSNHRKEHIEVEGIMCKKCSKCEEICPLTNFNNLTDHWDGLRTECKDCLHKYRISEICKKNRNKWYKNKINNDIQFKIRQNLKGRIWDTLKKKGLIKSNTTEYLVGCDIKYLIDYLEKKFDNNMNWDNYGSYWHLDHIIPCNSWDLTDYKQQLACYNYKNLQPLEGSENMSKSDKYDENDKTEYFDEFLQYYEEKWKNEIQ